MRRTEQAQGLRLMKFEEVSGAAVAVCWARRRRRRYWASRSAPSGAGGIALRRTARRVSTTVRLGLGRFARRSEVARPFLELFDTRYWDFTAKHFHEKLVAEHGCERSYNWVRLTLQAYGRRRAAPRRGAHRRKRPRRALPGMMVHRRLAPWVARRPAAARPDRHHGRRHERIYSAFFASRAPSNFARPR